MAQRNHNPFFVANPSQTITVGTSSAATALNGSTSNMRNVVELQNAGSAVVFVEPGFSSGVTATVAASYPILPGQSKLITIAAGVTHLATISGTASQTLYVTVGMGY
jgi:hypothetical protein